MFSVAALAAILALLLQLAGAAVAAHWILGTAALLAIVPLARDMWEDFSAGSYGIDVLALTAIITSVLLHEYGVAIVMVLMVSGGEVLEGYAERYSKSGLDTWLGRMPDRAHVIRGKKTLDVPATEVRAGDRIIIKPGEPVPADCVIIEGDSSFDQSSLTGESLPAAKGKGAILASGSINIGTDVTAKATQTAARSQYQRIAKLVRAAAGSQAPFARAADRYSIPFTIFAFALAGGIWIWSGQAIRFLEVIIVATPSPFILAAPIAITSGMDRSVRRGIIVRTASALERLARVRTLAFDKAGTLTEGHPRVADIIPQGKHTKSEVLSYAAALAAGSSHSLAGAIMEAAVVKKVRVPKARHAKEMAGSGLSATISGKRVITGHLSLLHKNGVAIPMQFMGASLQRTAVYVAIEGKLAGAITFTDKVRPESAQTLKRLKSLGIRHFLMATGDSQAAAKPLAKKLGIGTVLADASLAAKLQAVEAVAAKPVAYVGDGAHDAPVLTAADVGIARGVLGSADGSDSADIIIMRDQFSYVADSLQIARRSLKVARQGLLIGTSLSLILMLTFATGRFAPIYGAALQEVVDVVVICNALRAHSGGRQQDSDPLA